MILLGHKVRMSKHRRLKVTFEWRPRMEKEDNEESFGPSVQGKGKTVQTF